MPVLMALARLFAQTVAMAAGKRLADVVATELLCKAGVDSHERLGRVVESAKCRVEQKTGKQVP